jgi:nucleoside-diphosphate-sugar epimerase
MEGDDWDVKSHSPQHEHQSDGEEDDVEMDSPVHQELGYHSNITTEGGVYRGGQALHHRTNANRNASREQTQTAIGNESRPLAGSASKNIRNNNPFKRRRWSSLFRGSVVLGVVGYFFLMIRQSWLLTDWQYEKSTDSQLPPFDHRGMSVTRQLLDKKRVDDRRKALEDRRRHAAERLERTRPPETSEKLSSYEILSMEERQQSVTQPKVSSSRATLVELCGIHAKNASRDHPNSYLSKDALNSKSRVMITGILNPIGFHLALALKERCGVQVMTGIDPMFPNTVAHRLQLQERIQLLTTNIPKLVQPIVLPLVGLDPRLNQNQENEPSLLPTTGEISLLNFRPTHIVHLASYSPAEYMDPFNPQFWNHQSPYVTADRNPFLYRIRSSLASMEQILASIVSADNDSEAQRPHLTYASSSDHSDPVHVHLKLADELLADTYHSLHGAYSVGVRLPNAVYGPWGRAGTPMHQMADAAVELWNSTISSNELLESAGLGNVADRVDDFIYVSGTYFVFVPCK